MKLKGELLRSGEEYFFRIYNKAFPEGFKDYRLIADDISVEIDMTFLQLQDSTDPEDNYDGILDHSDAVLGYD